MLELLASKGARAVLRGREGSNAFLLPDHITEVVWLPPVMNVASSVDQVRNAT
jgi:hypothetical protein